MMPTSHPGAEPTLTEKVAFLRRIDAYSPKARSIEAVETHMAWVFLTDEHAWKLKKPVKTRFLDFSSRKKRCFDCKEEVRLNRRLAPDVYRGVVPLTVDEDGRLALNSDGKVVDCLVQMRRLKTGEDLESMIASGAVTETAVRQVACILASFYQEAPPVPTTADKYLAGFAQDVDETRRDLLDAAFNLPSDLIETVTAAQRKFLDEQSALLATRAETNRIIEAHGDLRPQHIWLTEPPVIIDRLEFNRELRILDPLSELAFLALDCERLNAAWIGECMSAICAEIIHDVPNPSLLEFYRRWHACTRARIALWHLRDETVDHPQKWRQKAARYLQLAAPRRFTDESTGSIRLPR